jgi:hypothetical protein
MHRSDWKSVLDAAGAAALDHLESLPERRVYPLGDHAAMRAALDHPPTETGLDPAQVVADLAGDLGPYVTAHASGRFFGFVIGGLHPASWGAEILVSKTLLCTRRHQASPWPKNWRHSGSSSFWGSRRKARSAWSREGKWPLLLA